MQEGVCVGGSRGEGKMDGMVLSWADVDYYELTRDAADFKMRVSKPGEGALVQI